MSNPRCIGRPESVKGGRLLAGLLAPLLALATLLPLPADASSRKYAAVIIDANSGATLHADGADELRYPASLTKMMTIYIALELIEQRKLSFETRLKITDNAAAASPSKLDLEAGEEISVRDAIRALITKSANDVAVTLAENIAGTEEKFARIMTWKARQLGMKRTVFKNASGLPDSGQLTTARDMVTLALRLMDDFPQHYHLFSTRAFSYAGSSYRNHNTLLFTLPGTDGLKTGYTRASGFNIVTSVKRGDKHLVGAVFGGSSAGHRNAQMRILVARTLPKASSERTRRPMLVASAGRPQQAHTPPRPKKPVQVADADDQPPAAAGPVARGPDRTRAPRPGAGQRQARATPPPAATPPAPERRAPAPASEKGGPEPVLVEPVRPAPLPVDVATAPPPTVERPAALPPPEKPEKAVEVAPPPVTPAPPPVVVASPIAPRPTDPPVAVGRPPSTLNAQAHELERNRGRADENGERVNIAGKGDFLGLRRPSEAPQPREIAPPILPEIPDRAPPRVRVAENAPREIATVRQPDSVPAVVPPLRRLASDVPPAPERPRTDAIKPVPAVAPAAAPRLTPAAVKPQAGAFQIQIGAFASPDEAGRRIADAKSKAGDLLARYQPVTQPVPGRPLYRARFAGFDQQAAATVCGELKRRGIECIVARSE